MTLVAGLIVATEAVADGKVERADGVGALGERGGTRRAEKCLRAIQAVVGLGVEVGLLVLASSNPAQASPGAESVTRLMLEIGA